MPDAMGNAPSFLGNPGEPVPEVDANDLKTFWQRTRDLQARVPEHVSIGLEANAICGPDTNARAVWYRTSMIAVLNHVAPEQMAPWIRDQQVSDVVFRTMASIPMEWIGPAEREGLPFDVEEFFRRLRDGGEQNG